MTDDREPFREARAAWKAKHHQQRLENATYTAAEVKVLTEVAMRLGRKEAGEEIAAALKRRRDEARAEEHRGWPLLTEAWVIAQDVASQPAPDATTARTDPSGYSDLPQDSKAGRSPQGETNG